MKYSAYDYKVDRSYDLPGPGRNCMTHRQELKDFPDKRQVLFHENNINSNVTGAENLSLYTHTISIQAYKTGGPRATPGPRDVADWPDNGLDSCLVQCPVVSSDLTLGYSFNYN
jgi:hypothetical protein